MTSLPQAGLFDEDGNKKQPIAMGIMEPAGELRLNAEDMLTFLSRQMEPGSGSVAFAIKRSHMPIYTDSSLSV